MWAAVTRFLVDAALVAVKLLVRVNGYSHALVGDAVESSTHIYSLLIVWASPRVTTWTAHEDPPTSTKAEALATAVVSLMLIGVAEAVERVEIGEAPVPAARPG
jgi:divalent metal cation (Fe/Co/Zn/Cd) transporter